MALLAALVPRTHFLAMPGAICHSATELSSARHLIPLSLPRTWLRGPAQIMASMDQRTEHQTRARRPGGVSLAV